MVDRPTNRLAQCLEQASRSVALRGELLNQQSSSAPFTQPLLDAVGLFEYLNIRYALVGGIASMFYGRSRFADDIVFALMPGYFDLLASNPDAMDRWRFNSSWLFCFTMSRA